MSGEPQLWLAAAFCSEVPLFRNQRHASGGFQRFINSDQVPSGHTISPAQAHLWQAAPAPEHTGTQTHPYRDTRARKHAATETRGHTNGYTTTSAGCAWVRDASTQAEGNTLLKNSSPWTWTCLSRHSGVQRGVGCPALSLAGQPGACPFRLPPPFLVLRSLKPKPHLLCYICSAAPAVAAQQGS